jgi:putative membrane protein
MRRILVTLALGIPIVVFGAASNPDQSSQEAKDFGATMIKDHSAANDRLQGIAAAKSVVLPTSASRMQTVGPAIQCEIDADSEPSGAQAPLLIGIRQIVDTEPDQGEQGDCRSPEESDCDRSGCADQELRPTTLPVIQPHLEKARSISVDSNGR